MNLPGYNPDIHELVIVNGITRGFRIKKTTQAPEMSKPTFQTRNEQITQDGRALGGMGNTYYAPVGAAIQLKADIVDALGNLQTQIDQSAGHYPPILKMPVVKMAGGALGSVIDEAYFTVRLSGGVLTATGAIPSSGDWKLTESRINRALQSINAGWEVNRDTTTFLV